MNYIMRTFAVTVLSLGLTFSPTDAKADLASFYQSLANGTAFLNSSTNLLRMAMQYRSINATLAASYASAAARDARNAEREARAALGEAATPEEIDAAGDLVLASQFMQDSAADYARALKGRYN
jgi:hypothetical protein